MCWNLSSAECSGLPVKPSACVRCLDPFVRPSRSSLRSPEVPADDEQDDAARLEAERKLEELKRRRDEAESEELERMRQRQQEAEAELEGLKRKREERRKVLEEEERQRKQEEAERKAKEEVRLDPFWKDLLLSVFSLFPRCIQNTR